MSSDSINWKPWLMGQRPCTEGAAWLAPFEAAAAAWDACPRADWLFWALYTLNAPLRAQAAAVIDLVSAAEQVPLDRLTQALRVASLWVQGRADFQEVEDAWARVMRRAEQTPMEYKSSQRIILLILAVPEQIYLAERAALPETMRSARKAASLMLLHVVIEEQKRTYRSASPRPAELADIVRVHFPRPPLPKGVSGQPAWRQTS